MFMGGVGFGMVTKLANPKVALTRFRILHSVQEPISRVREFINRPDFLMFGDAARQT